MLGVFRTCPIKTTAVENLFLEAALRRGVTVDTYRGLIQAITDRAGGSFATALRVVAVFEKMPPGERNTLFEQLPITEQQAARFGLPVGRPGLPRPMLSAAADL